MADQRITQLTKLAQVDVAANDVLPVVDVGASTTKKVEVKELFQAGANLADSSSIDLIKLNQASTTKLGTTALADDAVTAAKLANDSSIAYDSVAPTIDNFEGRGYVNSTSKNLQVWNGTSFDQVVAPTAGIADLAVTTGKLANGAVTTAKVDAAGLAADALATNAVTTAKILNGAVTADKLGALSVTTAKIAADAVTAAELANNSVDTAAIVDAAVTESKLATNAVSETKLANGAVTVAKIADTQITYAKLNLADGSVPGAKLVSNSVTSSQMALDSVTTSALTNLNVTTAKLADSAATTAKIADGAITTAKVDAAGLAAAAIATDAITTAKVLDGAITAAKLADDSTTIVQAGTPTGSGDFEGQLWFDTNTSVQYVWNNTAWIRQAAINVINFTDSTPIAFSVAYPNNHTATVTTTLDTQVANRAFVGPATGADAAPTFRALVPEDLPDATASTKGIIQPGTGLDVNGGTLNHSNSVTAGTYTKLTVDAQGHVSAGTILEAADIPDIDAAKITTGGLVTDRLADNAVTIDKLADYSTASLGETLPTPSFIGQIHLNPLDKAFFMWDGNVWVPIGISAGQIIFAGTFDASAGGGAGAIASLTPEGVAAGFSIGALPASSATNNKHYFVVSEGGTITSGNAPNVALAPPDLILSVYNTSSPGWVEVDVSSGAGAISANQVSFTPAGDLGSTSVQAAIEEVSTECRNATNITSGTLAVARGGTNLASYTKGDIIVASGATTLVKLPVGTNGQVLTADSTETSGLKYTTPTVGTVTTVSSSTAALTVATSTTTPALTIRSATTSVDGIVQLSDSTGTTSSTLAATSTAVKAAYDLANAALPKAGGAITGELLIGNAGTLVFEGSTNDGNETTLAVADPTVDRTITLPDQTGTVLVSNNASIVNADINASAAIAHSKLAALSSAQVLLGNASNVPTATTVTGDVTISNAGVTSIASGVIVDADINSDAEIAVSKLADGTSRQLLQTDAAGTGVEWTSDVDIPGTLDVTGAATLDSTLSVPSGTAALPSIYPGTDANTGIYSPGADQLAVSTGGTGRLFVDSSGNVGIATSSPGNELHIASASNVSGPLVRLQNTGTTSPATGYVGLDNNNVFLSADSGGGIVSFRTGGGSEKARIDPFGRLLVGTSSARSNFFNSTFSPLLQVEGTAANESGRFISLVGNYSGVTAPHICVGKSRGTTTGSNTVVASGDDLGAVSFFGADGSELVEAARIQAQVDGTPGADDMPGRLVFSTTADGASTPTERMRIDSSGNSTFYGPIYTAPSSTTAGIYGPDELNNISNNTEFQLLRTRNGAGIWGFKGPSNNQGSLIFKTHSTQNSPTERLRIDSSGRLLVGTSSARDNFYSSTVTAGLQVEGTTSSTASISVVANFDAPGNVPYLLLGKTRSTTVGGNTVVANNDLVGYLTFQGADGTELVETARIEAQVDGTPGADDMPGRLMFSTTADGASSPTERMRIASNGNIFVNTISNPTTINKVGIVNILSDEDRDAVNIKHEKDGNNSINIWQTGTNTFNALHFFKGNSQTGVGTISVSTTGTSYNTVSDYRIKENVTPLTGAIDRLKDLQVHSFNFIADPDRTVDGFIAHEAQAVVPECVTGTKDEVDDEGNPVYQGIDQSKLVPLLTAALQEALAKIETLEARLTAAGI